VKRIGSNQTRQTLRKHAINVMKVEFAVPNDPHNIKNCEYDRDVLDSFECKWATIVKDR